MFRLLAPHLQVKSVLDLDVDRLRRLGLDALLLDVDCTLKSYSAQTASAEVAAWLEGLRAAGIGLCLVSNGLARRVRRFAEGLELPFVANAGKPLPFGCRAALRKMGFDRRRTAMVGDQLFADVMAGRLAGLVSILVCPIHPEEEPWFTRVKRPLEKFLLRRVNVGSGEGRGVRGKGCVPSGEGCVENRLPNRSAHVSRPLTTNHVALIPLPSPLIPHPLPLTSHHYCQPSGGGV